MAPDPSNEPFQQAARRFAHRCELQPRDESTVLSRVDNRARCTHHQSRSHGVGRHGLFVSTQQCPRFTPMINQIIAQHPHLSVSEYSSLADVGHLRPLAATRASSCYPKPTMNCMDHQRCTHTRPRVALQATSPRGAQRRPPRETRAAQTMAHRPSLKPPRVRHHLLPTMSSSPGTREMASSVASTPPSCRVCRIPRLNINLFFAGCKNPCLG